MKLPAHVFDEIKVHAEATYPEECCGVVFSSNSNPNVLVRLKRCRNAQNEFHAMDPENFPRTNRNAYFIDPKDLLAIEAESREHNGRVRLIYHSHPDAAAYFSKEDQFRATVDGTPLHPNADYLVVSVLNGQTSDAKLFGWDRGIGKFIEKTFQNKIA